MVSLDTDFVHGDLYVSGHDGGPMWSALISNELNFYRVAGGQRGYKSSAPWYWEHQQPSGAPRRSTQHPPRAQKAVDETVAGQGAETDG